MNICCSEGLDNVDLRRKGFDDKIYLKLDKTILRFFEKEGAFREPVFFPGERVRRKGALDGQADEYLLIEGFSGDDEIIISAALFLHGANKRRGQLFWPL